MLTRFAEVIHRRARLVLVLSVLGLAVAAGIGFGAFGKLKTGGFDDPAAASTQAREVLDARLGGQPNLVLLVTAPDGVDQPAAQAAGARLAADLDAEETITSVISYWGTRAPSLRSGDGTQALIVAHVTGDDQIRGDHTEAIIERYAGDRDGLTVQPGGDAVANVDVPSEVGKSLAIAEAIAVPLTLILLLIAFRSVVAAMVPLAIGTVAIFGTFALLFVLGGLTDVSVFAINLTTALGLGLGIDYALLLVSRFREEMATGASTKDAVVRTVETAGRTIIFSAATVAAALAALLVFPQFFLRSFAYAGVGVVAIAALAALVIVPALLAVLGPRINAGRLPWARGTAPARSALWGRLAAFVMRRPALAAAPVLVALAIAAAPLFNISFGTPDQGVLPASAASRQVADTIAAKFPDNAAGAQQVVIVGTSTSDAIQSYADRLRDLPGVSRVDIDRTAAAADLQRITVVGAAAPKSAEAEQLVHNVRAIPGPNGTEVLVGGDDARLVDTKAAIGDRLPLAIALIVLTTFVLLFLFTGSIVQPLRALVLNAVGLASTLGVMTWIFQDGNLSGLLGFTPRPMDTAMTVLLFCIAFGLSMDYEVFLTSRIKELHDRGANLTESVTHGLGHTGRIVTTAAALLAVSFFAFGTSSVSFLQMFGLGAGLAILIDATLIRGILVPASMRLLGRAAWYSPRLLRRVHARVALSEA